MHSWADFLDSDGLLHRWSPFTNFPQVVVVDLDSKPLEKIEEHYELDCAIMHEYRQHCMSTH